MKRLGRPEVWFALALIGLAAAGTWLVAHPDTLADGANERTHHPKRFYWRSAFDAVSAACGSGLSTRDVEGDYSPRGRWLLLAVGACGALLFVAAAAQVARRLRAAAPGGRVPHPLLVVAAFVVVQALCVPLMWAAGAGQDANSWSDAAWRAVATFSSLGWPALADHSGDRGTFTGVAAIALLGALGWPLWLLMIPPLRRRFTHAPGVLLASLGYVAFLLVAAGVVCALESPRPTQGRAAPQEALSQQPVPQRYLRCAAQAFCAAGAGVQTEALDQPSVHDATKVVLAGVVFVGGMGGSAGGGIKWPLAVWLLAAGGAAVGLSRRRSKHEATMRCMLAAAGCTTLLAALVVITALGLLIIDDHTRSPFDHPPTFADALLDATSAVAGGNLSSGLAARVTGENLSSGMRQPVDQYQYGMAWLMAAMLLGRVLPLWVLRRVADAALDDAPVGVTPML